MRPLRYLSILFAIFYAFAPAIAQALYEGNNNLPPFGSFTGSNFDIVSLQNGNLHLHIPIGSWKQRGGKTLTADFIYDAPSWTWATTMQIINNERWYMTKISPSGGGFSLSTNWGEWFVESSISTYQCPNGTSTNWYNNWTVTDPEGTKHPLSLSTMPSGGCLSGNTVSPTLDGTGMMVNIGGSSPLLTLKDGTQIPLTKVVDYDFQAITVEDTNGNQISASSDTLLRNLVAVTHGTNYDLLALKDSNGTSQTYRIDYTSINGQTHFCPSGYTHEACGELSGSRSVPQRLTLPDGTFYLFSWVNNDLYELQSVALPTGATITYGYGYGSGSALCLHGPIVAPYDGTTIPHDCRANTTSRTLVVGGNSSLWQYSGGVVTDPNLNDEAHVFNIVTVNGVNSPNAVETDVSYYQGSSTAGTLLKKVHTDYTGESNQPGPLLGNIRPIRKTTTLDNGLVTKTETDYETFTATISGGAVTVTRLNPTETREYAYASGAPGALLRRTHYTYLHNNNSVYVTLNIVDRPASVMVYDNSSNTCQGQNRACSQTTYEYDVYNHPGLPGMGSSGAVQHDPARNTTYSTRGNQTAISRWLNTTGAFLTTLNQYDDAGNIIASKDPNGNVTSFDYADAWANAGCAPSGQGKAFPTTITDALTHLKKLTYNSCTGSLASLKDQNDINASRPGTVYSYDLLGRVTQVSWPDGGQTTNCYSDVGGSICSQSGPPYSIVTAKPIISGVTLTTTSLTDGLGRVSQTQLNSDPDGVAYTAVTYDSLGRASQKYNPTRCNSPTTQCTQGPPPGNIPETTWGYSTTRYDALSRTKSVTEQDGSVVSTTFSGNCATATDETGKSRTSCSDALGRLTQVTEDPGGLGYVTSYTYDALNNLTGVVQNGSRQRTFAYDSLSRLTSASNPESGTASYVYDSNGNLLTKTSPAPNQTASNTVTLSHCYDALNRPTAKAYTFSPATPPTCSGTPPTFPSPVATYAYDQASANGLTITNGVGRRTGMTDQAGAEAWSYDSMGRALFERRTTNSVSKTIPYTYNLDGSLFSVATPTFADGSHSITVTYTPGGAGRPLAVTSNGGNIAINLNYTPAGQLCNSLGQWNGNWTTVKSFNNRLQPVFNYTVRQTAGSPPAPPPCAVSTPLPNNPLNTENNLALSYAYPNGQNNGNISSITNLLFSPISQSFTYDSLNRLTSAQTTGTYATYPTYCWAESYTYDAWGNLLSDQPNPTSQSAYTGCTAEITFGTTANAKNQIALLTYDAAGNVQTSCGVYMAAPGTCTYDAENHLTQFSWSGGSNTYTYDGDGKRVMKSGSPGTIYWYGAGSDVLIESDLSNNNQAVYEYFNGQRVARVLPNNEVGLYFTDHLGNTRYFQSLGGDEVSDFYPFGGERAYANGTTTHYKFTGKERDSESGLDNFGPRYLGSSMGRFMSPDPLGGHQEDPQTLNKYSYVRNNPLKLTDPTGLDFYLGCVDSDTLHKGCVYTKTFKEKGEWVQADENGNAIIVTSDSIRAGQNTATIDWNGVTINGKSQGIYFDNPASQTRDTDGNVVDDRNPLTLAGSGVLKDFTITINGNCSGTCLSSGTWSFPGTWEDARKTLYSRGSVAFPGEDEKADMGFGAHPYTTQHRFAGPSCSNWVYSNSCQNSPHLSVPYDPQWNVPQGFHVDAHGDMYHHRQDVEKQGVE